MSLAYLYTHYISSRYPPTKESMPFLYFHLTFEDQDKAVKGYLVSVLVV